MEHRNPQATQKTRTTQWMVIQSNNTTLNHIFSFLQHSGKKQKTFLKANQENLSVSQIQPLKKHVRIIGPSDSIEVYD